MDYKYVFDLDNTLIYTDKLNNASYNYALRQIGLLPTHTNKRITREYIATTYPYLSRSQCEEIIVIKQEFFIKNIKDTKENKNLFNILKSKNKENCILWTSADNIRAKELVKHYKIDQCFITTIYSNKTNILSDIDSICEFLRCKKEYLVFYEDNDLVIDQLKAFEICVHKV